MSKLIDRNKNNNFINFVLLTLTTYALICVDRFSALDANIILKQGTIVGLKVFPETSKLPVYAYLGVPYAEPPIDGLRFAKPQPHKGWNRTFFARDFKPTCPQPQNNVFQESNEDLRSYNENYRTSEDCLYLNIWTPESAFRYGNSPVLVIVTGEDMAFDWIVHRPSGLDLAAEGVVVVTVQYRTNIFGWFGLENTDAPSNLGLWDQNMALLWIKDNIPKFGGDPKKITLLGHGTSGAACTMIHLVSPQSREIFSKVIIMSGTLFSPYSFQLPSPTDESSNYISERIVKNLACNSENINQTLICMREKSVDDLLKAFENIYLNGNYTRLLGPRPDDFLGSTSTGPFIPDDPRKMIRLSSFGKVPIMIGITNNEGAFMHDQWIDLARQGYKTFKKYISETVLSNLIEVFSFEGRAEPQIRETINWKFFDQIPKTNVHLMNALHKILSETRFELPFYETIEILSSEGRIVSNDLERNDLLNVSSWGEVSDRDDVMMTRPRTKVVKRKTNEQHQLYVYSFQQDESIDMRGKRNWFGGSAHSADLPFLMGPSLLQQIGRRRLTANEEKLSRKTRQMFCDFIKSSNPTPGRLFDAWHPYTQKQKYIKMLGGRAEIGIHDKSHTSYDFEQNINQIEQLLTPTTSVEIVTNQDDGRKVGLFNPYILGVENRPSTQSDRQTKAYNYMGEHNNSEYFLYLTKIYSFWRILLPKIHKNFNKIDKPGSREGGNHPTDDDPDVMTEFSENINAVTTTPKYKHAFFSMLVLVCLLLGILCICVYILKKNQSNLDTSFL